MEGKLTAKQRLILGHIMAEAGGIRAAHSGRINLRKFVKMPRARVNELCFLLLEFLPEMLERCGEDEIMELPKMLGPDTDFGVDLPAENWEF